MKVIAFYNNKTLPLLKSNCNFKSVRLTQNWNRSPPPSRVGVGGRSTRRWPKKQTVQKLSNRISNCQTSAEFRFPELIFRRESNPGYSRWTIRPKKSKQRPKNHPSLKNFERLKRRDVCFDLPSMRMRGDVTVVALSHWTKRSQVRLWLVKIKPPPIGRCTRSDDWLQSLLIGWRPIRLEQLLKYSRTLS